MAAKYDKLTDEIISKVGGAANVQALSHCVTRLRFVLKDEAKVNDSAVEGINGVLKVIHANGQYQVVIGTHVPEVYKTIIQCGLVPQLGEGAAQAKDTKETEKTEDGKKKKFSFIDLISSTLMPVMSGMMATGILKGLLIMFSTLGWMDASGSTYTVLYAAADAFFYFLPLALAITAAKKFECNQFVAFAVVGVLLYPNLITALAAEGGLKFLGLPVTNVSYSSTVIPALVTVWLLSILEKQLNKIFPELIRSIFVPMLCVVIMVPVELIVIGPAMNWIGQLLADGYLFVYSLNPAIAGAILAGLWPLMVMVGAHMATFPIAINNMTVYGQDTLLPVTTGMNYAIAGAALAVALKTKNKDLKKMGITSAFSAIVGGVTEPAIYGIVLKYKKPFYICMGCIALGGLAAGIAGSAFPTMISTSIITLPAMAAFPGGWGFVAAAVIGFVGALVITYLFGFNDKMLDEVK